MTLKMMCEILNDIDKAPDVVRELKRHLPNQSLKQLLGSAFIPKGKFKLPPGAPPYRISTAPKDTNSTNLLYESKKLDKFRDPNMKQSRREELFIKTLEELFSEEASILIAVKDQILESIFPNITLQKVIEAGYFGQPWFPEDWVDPMIEWKKENQVKEVTPVISIEQVEVKQEIKPKQTRKK
jgi:hypothetical protein